MSQDIYNAKMAKFTEDLEFQLLEAKRIEVEIADVERIVEAGDQAATNADKCKLKLNLAKVKLKAAEISHRRAKYNTEVAEDSIKNNREMNEKEAVVNELLVMYPLEQLKILLARK